MGINVEIGYGNLDHLIAQLEELKKSSKTMCKRSIFRGAKIVADEMKREIKGIPVVPDHDHGDAVITGATRAQIDGLIESMGLAKIKNYEHGLNTKVGFDGYNSVVTKKYPKGQPNMMIARSINAGTSFRNKYPFVERSARMSKDEAEAVMAASLQKYIDDIVNS